MNMGRTTQFASSGSNSENNQKLLEELTTQMLLMQRTMKTMADELTELRKISLEIKEGQNQIVSAIGAVKGAPIQAFSFPKSTANNETVAPLSTNVTTVPTALNFKSSGASFNFGRVFPTSFEAPKRTIPPVSYFNLPEKKIEFPTVELVMRLEQYAQIGVEKALQSIKELPNWKQEFMNKANACCLMNAAKKQTLSSDKDQFVTFLKEQSEGIDLSRSDTWQYRLEIIVDALSHAPDSILFDNYKKPITEYVNVWKNELQNDFDAIKVIVNGLSIVFSKSTNEGAFIEAVDILSTISERLSVEQRNAIGTQEFMKVLLNVMYPTAHSKFLVQAWRLLWNITDESPSNCINFCSCGGLDTFVSQYTVYKNNSNYELLINMFGTIGNIVEVEVVRKTLWKETCMSILKDVLLTQSMELRVFAAGIIAEVISDNPIDNEYSQLLLETIPKWTSAVPLSVNYSSLKPLARLLTVSPACHLYAAWFLSNLLVTNREKYLPMFTKDNFETILRNLYTNPETLQLTKELAVNVLSQI